MIQLDWLLPQLENLGAWAYWIVLFFAFVESLAFVGSIIPGASVVIFSGFLASQGYLHVGNLLWLAALGAVLGDSASYSLGTKGTHWFKSENKWLKKSHLEQGQAYFKKHGGKSLLLGRFIPVLRPIVPFVAGLSRMEKKQFYFWNITSGIAWSIVHVFFGFFFGNAVVSVDRWSHRIAIIAIALAFVSYFTWIATKKAPKM